MTTLELHQQSVSAIAARLGMDRKIVGNTSHGDGSWHPVGNGEGTATPSIGAPYAPASPLVAARRTRFHK
ncbi:hypothetical protein GD416_27595 [Burkholderia sp. BE24]|nr:hypothetical protein [Burkholderia sp. BE24]